MVGVAKACSFIGSSQGPLPSLLHCYQLGITTKIISKTEEVGLIVEGEPNYVSSMLSQQCLSFSLIVELSYTNCL